MCKKKEENIVIRPLSKKTDLGKDNPYVKRLLKSTEEKNIHNIGVFGSYGSGKSSVVGSFIDESKRKAIYFSQDTFNKHIYKGKDEKGYINIREAIYKELLSYNTASVKFKNYLKSLFRKFSDIVITVIWLLFFLCVASFVGIYTYKYIEWCCIPAGIACFLAELLIYFLFTQNRIKELNIKVGQAVTFLVDPEEEITDAIADHPAAIENILIKILKTNNIKFIVVEDIERLDATQKVKDYLKEFKVLNDLINRSKEYSKDPIVFIYGLKDWCIGNSEERTKYFDYIVKILPYTSFSNAEDSLLSDKTVSNDGISKELIFDISIYFSNQRQINALMTEYEISSEEAKSGNLKNELFTLAALNVLFPQIYCLLSHKNNFLDFALKSDEKSDTFVDDLKSKIISQINELKEEERLEDSEKMNLDDVLLFLKMAITNRYLTFNYEKLMCKNFDEAMVSTDRDALKKIRGFERIDDCEIAEPESFLSRLHGKEYVIFSDVRYLNIDLVKYIVTSNNSERKNKLKAQINSLSVGDLTNFLDKYIEKYPNSSDVNELIKLISFDKKVYLASCKTKNYLLTCFLCLKNAVVPTLTTNKTELKPFFNVINSTEFMPNYAHEISIDKYKELSTTSEIHFEDLSSFCNQSDYLSVFRGSNMYAISFQNLSILYENFNSCPIHVINSNLYIKAQIKSLSATKIKIMLDMCDCLKAKDTGNDIISFLQTFEQKENVITILGSNYFNQWELKISTSLFDRSEQSVEVLKRGLFNVTEQAFIVNTIKTYPKSLEACFRRIPNKINNASFTWQDSNEIAIKMDTDIVLKVSKSLDMTGINNVISSDAEEEKVMKLLKLLGDKEKREFLQNVADDNKPLLIEAAKTRTISADDLKEIILDNSILDAFINNCDDDFIDLFGLSQNETVAINAMQKPGSTIDYSRLFIDKQGNVKKRKSIALIIAYCSSTKRNFDSVVAIIESMGADAFSDKKAWKKFILSFSTSDSKEPLLYFEPYANNERILDKFYNCGLLTEKKRMSTKNLYRCKLID